MTRGRDGHLLNWPTMLGLAAVVIVIVAIATILFGSRGGTPQSGATQQVSPTTDAQVSATSELLSAKATIEEIERETQAAGPTLPAPGSVATPTEDTRPTTTPSFPDATPAGAGVIVLNPAIPAHWGRVAINMWAELALGTDVYAGGTNDPDQGAIFILRAGDNMDSPETYLTPARVGLVQVVDANGERLVLKTLSGDYTFYFDIPTRQFVDSLTITSAAPTVTPMATTTPIELPTSAPLPSAYPVELPTDTLTEPTAQSTAGP